jgi:hypothetical protein
LSLACGKTEPLALDEEANLLIRGSAGDVLTKIATWNLALGKSKAGFSF